MLSGWLQDDDMLEALERIVDSEALERGNEGDSYDILNRTVRIMRHKGLAELVVDRIQRVGGVTNEHARKIFNVAQLDFERALNLMVN